MTNCIIDFNRCPIFIYKKKTKGATCDRSLLTAPLDRSSMIYVSLTCILWDSCAPDDSRCNFSTSLCKHYSQRSAARRWLLTFWLTNADLVGWPQGVIFCSSFFICKNQWNTPLLQYFSHLVIVIPYVFKVLFGSRIYETHFFNVHNPMERRI